MEMSKMCFDLSTTDKTSQLYQQEHSKEKNGMLRLLQLTV